jgi:DNA processing protein
MNHDELRYWLALKSTEGIGNLGFRNLLESIGTPRAVFSASLNALKSVQGVGEKTAAAIKDFKNWEKVDEDLTLAEKLNVDILTCQDSSYPRNLLNIYDFPVLLYVRGSLKEDDCYIAVIGSRMASTYGKFCTERFCRELVLKGMTVVSGLARGIDSAAHRGAIAVHGRTIAVLGCGIDVVYPPENKKLYSEIIENGAVITELPFGTPPNAPNFPARNRIISGISLGVLVVEAGEKSGSLITARMALEQGREVFAVPGSIDSGGSRGTHLLIKQGAKLTENVYDILDEILPQLNQDSTEPSAKFPDTPLQTAPLENTLDFDAIKTLNDAEKTVLNILSSEKKDIDTIIRLTGLKTNEILNILLNLELREFVTQLPGKMYIKKEQ